MIPARIVIAAGALCVAAFGVSGCNTVEGVGKDVQSAGRVIERASEEVREDLSSGRTGDAPERDSGRPE